MWYGQIDEEVNLSFTRNQPWESCFNSICFRLQAQRNKWTVAWWCVNMVSFGHFSSSSCISTAKWTIGGQIVMKIDIFSKETGQWVFRLWSQAFYFCEKECSVSPSTTWCPNFFLIYLLTIIWISWKEMHWPLPLKKKYSNREVPHQKKWSMAIS